ncbi:hypothetical protein HPB47_007436, partial [Ixodes persulcatus]
MISTASSLRLGASELDSEALSPETVHVEASELDSEAPELRAPEVTFGRPVEGVSDSLTLGLLLNAPNTSCEERSFALVAAAMKGDEDSESVSLVGRDAPGSYTEDPRPTASLRETDYVDTDVPLQSQFHEDAVAQAGEGLFQWLVFLVCGLGLAADSIEVMVIAYVLPSAERELCMDDSRKGWLGGVSFVGMMIGGLVWGNLADKMGRRRTLLSALLTNALFSVITTFMPTYGLFAVTRLCSGIGVGGSIPIVFTYYSEFLLKKHRGRNLCWLLLFWAIGGVFVSVTAWGLIPRTGTTLLGLGRLHFSSWRVFLLVCSLPSIVSVVGLAFLPESPRFLLE